METDLRVAAAIGRLRFLKKKERDLVWWSFRTWDALRHCSLKVLQETVGRRITEQYNHGALLQQAEKDVETVLRDGITMVSIHDSRYPPLLREITDAPFVLYVRGELPDPEEPCAAIVGTRRPTHRGLQGAFRIGYGLAKRKVPVISGLAMGIDAAAHQGALAGSGKTFAFLAGGVDVVSPMCNRKIAFKMLDQGGGLISDYPPGTAPLKFHFPNRNRLISGVSRGVLIVQAPLGSGALLTADYALEHNRDLAVYRDCLGYPGTEGTTALSLDGAAEVSNAVELLYSWDLPPGSSARFRPQAEMPLSGGSELFHSLGRQAARELETELTGKGVFYCGELVTPEAV